MPPTLATLLERRGRTLEPGERDLLGRAAVVGRTISRAGIVAVTPAPELLELDGRLAALERRRLIRATPNEYEFVHPLVRDAAFAAVARDERAYLHEGLARWLESRGGAGRAGCGNSLERAALRHPGVHPPEQRVSRESTVWLGRAGREAVLASDSAGARNLLERALTVLDNEALLIGPTSGVCSARPSGLGQLEDAITHLEGIAARARTDRDRRIEMPARVELV